MIRGVLKSKNLVSLFNPDSIEIVARLQRMPMPTAFINLLDNVVESLYSFTNFQAALKKYGVKKNF